MPRQHGRRHLGSAPAASVACGAVQMCRARLATRLLGGRVTGAVAAGVWRAQVRGEGSKDNSTTRYMLVLSLAPTLWRLGQWLYMGYRTVRCLARSPPKPLPPFCSLGHSPHASRDTMSHPTSDLTPPMDTYVSWRFPTTSPLKAGGGGSVRRTTMATTRRGGRPGGTAPRRRAGCWTTAPSPAGATTPDWARTTAGWRTDQVGRWCRGCGETGWDGAAGVVGVCSAQYVGSGCGGGMTVSLSNAACSYRCKVHKLDPIIS